MTDHLIAPLVVETWTSDCPLHCVSAGKLAIKHLIMLLVAKKVSQRLEYFDGCRKVSCGMSTLLVADKSVRLPSICWLQVSQLGD